MKYGSKTSSCQSRRNKKKSPYRLTDSMFIEPTEEQEIKGIVRDLLPNTSPGRDDILPGVVRAVIDQISAPLCDICNKPFQTGVFPDKLKLAKVIPVFKSENKSLLTNYRSISVLSLFSKLLESLMHIRITEFINKNKILSENQYGFPEKRSTYMALL